MDKIVYLRYNCLIKHLKVKGEGYVLIWGAREFQRAAAVGIKENFVDEVQKNGIRILGDDSYQKDQIGIYY